MEEGKKIGPNTELADGLIHCLLRTVAPFIISSVGFTHFC